MDVDSPKVIPGTPNADAYGSLGDADDLSRRTTPAFFELENGHLEGQEESEERSNEASGQVQQQGNGAGAVDAAVGAVSYVMDLDNGDRDDEPLQVQHLTAHRLVSLNTSRPCTSTTANKPLMIY